MAMRSWLFVPGDSETKLGKVVGAGADAVVVDLEDAVAPAARTTARRLAHSWLEAHRQQVLKGGGSQRWVRINPLDSGIWREDLAAVMPAAPHGIVVPKATGPEQLRMLAAELYEHEQRAGIPTNTTRVLPMVSETPQAALSITSYAAPDLTLPRLAALTWGAEDLAAAIGATRKRDHQGQWADPFRLVRSQMLLAAHACKVAAIDAVYADFKDTDGLRRIARASYGEGFTGMLAIHPAQVPIINEAFSPSEQDVARALAIVDAFAENPGAGALQLDGEMIEQPHLLQARRVLEQAQ